MTKQFLTPLAFKTLLTIVSALFCLSISAQEVSDVKFKQDGNQVIIDYSLDEKSTVSVFVSTDGGRSFGEALKKVKGDVGKNVSAGENTIVWSPLEEIGGIKGDDIAFRVIAASNNERFTERVIFNNYLGVLTAASVYEGVGFSGFGVNVGSVKNIGWYADIFLRTSDIFYAEGFSFSGGPVFRISQNSALSVGLGATLGDLFGGINVAVGYNWFIKNFSLTARVSTLNFVSVDFQIGIGWCIRR